MFFRDNLYAFAALYLIFVKGQTTHPVNVGLEGSFFDPPTTSAQVNDTILFSFIGDIHTVTQSSFENPCSPLPGGFNSGAAGKGMNGTAPTLTWSLIITNATAPIWFFCEITRPMSHCNQGMVGAINPPSIDMYNQFHSAAQAVTGTPAPSATVILTGQGAFATGAPTASLGAVTPSPSSSSTVSRRTSSTSSSTTSTPSATQTASSSTNSHLGAIVGGSVAGGVALIGLFVLLWLLCLRKKKTPVTHEADDFFRYNPVPVRRPSEVFAETKRTENLSHNNSVTSNTTTNFSGRTPQFSPVRPQFPQSGPRTLSPPNLHRQPSAQSDVLSLTQPPSTAGYSHHSEQANNNNNNNNNLDIRTLAQEVAAVLYQGPPIPNRHQKDSASQDMRGQMTVQNLDHEDTNSMIIPQTQPPPNYHAATGPRGNVRHT